MNFYHKYIFLLLPKIFSWRLEIAKVLLLLERVTLRQTLVLWSSAPAPSLYVRWLRLNQRLETALPSSLLQ